VFIVVFALFVAPTIYGLVAFHGRFAPMLKPPVFQHIAFNSLANLAVMWGSIDLKGRLDQRLSDVLRRTAIFHGALAFFTLIARHYYSIPMLLVGAPISAIGGAVVTTLRQRAVAPRVAIVGPWHWIADDRELRCRRIEAPGESIADCDLVLITFEGPLRTPWTDLLSRALLAGKPVRHVAEYLEEARGVVAIAHFDIDCLPTSGLASYRTQKRLLDLAFVVLLAPIAAPIALFGAIGVWITMGRPVPSSRRARAWAALRSEWRNSAPCAPRRRGRPSSPRRAATPGSRVWGAGFGGFVSTSCRNSGTCSWVT
jgi:hypothetical protein